MSLLKFDPAENSNEYNAKWSLLRAMEWGNWPLFLSQLFAPLLFLFLPGHVVVAGVLVANLLWAGVRYRFVSLTAVNLGTYLVLLKWIICPSVAVYLYLHGETVRALLALLWPLLVVVALPLNPFPLRIGEIQEMLVTKIVRYKLGV